MSISGAAVRGVAGNRACAGRGASAMPAMRALLLLSLVACASCHYYDPPLDYVLSHNLAVADSLQGAYNQSAARSSTISVLFPGNDSYFDDLDVNASIELVGFPLMVDGSALGGENLSLLVAMGHRMEKLMCLKDLGEDYPPYACDAEYRDAVYSAIKPGWRCDLDHDNCIEYTNRELAEYGGEVTFIFRNVSDSVPFGSSTVPLPPLIVSEISDASGIDNLTVIVNATVTFIYEIDDRSSELGDCHSSLYNVSKTLYINEQRNFTIEGANQLFFLRRPVLREQWYRNNHFDMLVLSQSRIYLANVSLNGNASCGFRTHEFDVADMQHGLRQIVSVPLNGSGAQYGISGSTPTPLMEGNHTFGFYYAFDCPYEGLGKNNLSLEVHGFYGANSSHNETLLSRALSYSGDIDELGQPAQAGTSRPSAAAGTESLGVFSISAGMLGLLFILVVANRSLVQAK